MPQVIRSCPSCSKTVPADALVCPHCGAELPTSLIGVVAPSQDSPTSLIAGASVGGEVQKAPRSEVQRGGTLGEEEPDPLRDRLQAALGNGFELGARLGEGGFGVVYRARDVRLKRDVAVKLLRRELVSAQGFVERFEREAQALAALRHPNIVPVYSIGDQDDLIFLVMPFVSGVTLTDYLREHGRLSVAEAEQILRDVGGALSAAHAVGLVHRDIKPDNIMLEGPKKLPLLMDFGIAKTGQTGGGPSGPGLTATGMVMGTPYYMSPEQATADPAVDARSDIYSLGVLAYQLFTGQLPFTGDSIYAVLSHHLTTPVPEARTVRPDIPPRISAAVHRAMAKKPAERFQHVEEFLEALGGRGPALRRTKPGTRTLLALGNLVLLVALAAVVLSKGSARVARAPVHADLRVEGVWLRTANRVAPWERALTLSSLGLTGLDSVSLPAVDKKPARTVATPSLYVKAVRPDSGSITIDPIQLPAGSLIVLKPAQTLGTVQMTIGDSLPAIPVTVSGRMTVNLSDQPADTIPFHIDQIQLAATHGPIDFDLGFPSAQAARPLVPLDIVGVSFEDINRFRDEDQGSDQVVSTIDSGNFAVTSGSPAPHTLKKGEALRLHGFRGTIANVVVDSQTVALTLDGSVDSLPASLGTFPTVLQVFWSEHTIASAALGLVYLALLAAIVLYWKKGTR